MAGYLGAIPVPQATQHRETFTATSGQTTFNTAGYTGFLDVYLNGSHLSPADFTATNGSDVVLASGASADDVCDIISYTAFEVNSQTFTGGLDVTGGITADGLTVNSNGEILVDNSTQAFLKLDRGDAGSHYALTRYYTAGTEEWRTGTYNDSSSSFFIGGPTAKRLSITTGGDISFYEDTGSTAKFFWDASAESLGIGQTSTGSYSLGVTSVGNGYTAQLTSPTSTNTLGFANSSNSAGEIQYQSSDFIFRPAGTNRMRLTAAGNVIVGNSGTWAAGADVCMIEANGLIDISRNDTSTQSAIAFYNPNGGIGSITVGGSATAYNTSSDYRLKTDAQPMTGASDRVLALNPVNFKWIADGTRVDGFLAHEAQAVVPEAVTGTKDAMMDEEYEVSAATGDIYTAGVEAGFNEVSAAIEASPAYYDVDGNIIKAEVIAQAAVHEAYDAVDEVIHSADVEQPETLEDGQQWRETTAAVMGTRSVPDMQGIDQSKMVPLLVAALQEALARITALENA